MWKRALIVWLVIILAESVHGTLRTLFLEPSLGSFRARQLSVFTASAIIFTIAWATGRWIGAHRRRDLLAIGGAWVALTLCFEIALGRLVMGATWERIFEDYAIGRGGLMPFGLALMWLAPFLAGKISPALQRPAAASRVTASQLKRMNL